MARKKQKKIPGQRALFNRFRRQIEQMRLPIKRTIGLTYHIGRKFERVCDTFVEHGWVEHRELGRREKIKMQGVTRISGFKDRKRYRFFERDGFVAIVSRDVLRFSDVGIDLDFESMPHFWGRRTEPPSDKPAKGAAAAPKSKIGIPPTDRGRFRDSLIVLRRPAVEKFKALIRDGTRARGRKLIARMKREEIEELLAKPKGYLTIRTRVLFCFDRKVSEDRRDRLVQKHGFSKPKRIPRRLGEAQMRRSGAARRAIKQRSVRVAGAKAHLNIDGGVSRTYRDKIALEFKLPVAKLPALLRKATRRKQTEFVWDVFLEILADPKLRVH